MRRIVTLALTVYLWSKLARARGDSRGRVCISGTRNDAANANAETRLIARTSRQRRSDRSSTKPGGRDRRGDHTGRASFRWRQGFPLRARTPLYGIVDFFALLYATRFRLGR